MPKRASGEGSVYFSEKRQQWVAASSLRDGTRLYRYSKTLHGAIQKRDEAVRLRGGRVGSVRATDQFGAYLEKWIASHSLRVKPRTAERDAGLLRKHIIPKIGTIPLHRLTTPRIQQAIDDCAGKPATVAEIRRLVTQSLNDAVDWKLLGSNPAAKVKSAKIGKRTVQVMTVEELRAFLKKIRGHRDEALFLFYVLLGARRGEALGLMWRDVDFESRKITFTHQVQRIAGRLRLVSLKTATANRTLLAPQVIMAALSRRRIAQKKRRLKVGAAWEESDLVFTTDTGRMIEPRNVNRSIKALTGKGVHRLRHTALTNLLARQVPVKQVSAIAGHASADITLRVYAHLLAGMDQGAADVMDAIAEE